MNSTPPASSTLAQAAKEYRDARTVVADLDRKLRELRMKQSKMESSLRAYQERVEAACRRLIIAAESDTD